MGPRGFGWFPAPFPVAALHSERVYTEQSLPCTPLVPQVHERLGRQLANLDPALQVDMLWALCVLQQAQALELQAVLRPELHTQFLGEGGGLCAALGLRYPAYVPKARCGWEPLGPGPGETMGQGSPAFAALPPASR